MYPKYEQLKKMAVEKKYHRIPVAIEMYADVTTPVETLKKLRNVSQRCYLFESASQDERWGRYSFIVCNPEMEIVCNNGKIKQLFYKNGEKTSQAKPDEDNPRIFLRKLIEANKSPVLSEMPPFTGGLVGYFAYDYLKYGEPKLKLTNKGDFNDLDLMFFNETVVFDHYRQKIVLIANVNPAELDESLEAAKKKLKKLRNVLAGEERFEFEKLELKSSLETGFYLQEYSEKVEEAKKHIFAGDIFQMILSNPIQAKATGSLFDAYRVLRVENPSPYMFYLSTSDEEIAGASPETLIRSENGKLATFPLAGTRRRGKNEEEDLMFEKELKKSSKERAEHEMLVDLGRNDLGKVAKIGTVKVEKHMEIERFSQVMHLGSTVVAEILDKKDGLDVIDAVLPAGTLSGAPKFRACEIIEELEESKRGIYGGAIVLSPGPGRPDDAGICLDLIKRFAGNALILGVCLGHQAICQAFGGKIVHSKQLMHGKTSQVKIVSKSNLFKGIKSEFTAARYHSLTADPDSLPSELKITAASVDDQEIMAV